MATVGIIQTPMAGHSGPLTRLGSVLAESGHRVIAWAAEQDRAAVEASGAEVRSFEPGVDGDPLTDWLELATVMAEATVHGARLYAEQLLSERVDVVVHDCMAPWGRVAAEWLGLPRVCSNPIFPAASQPHGVAVPPQQALMDRLAAARDTIGRSWGVDIGGVRDVLANPGRLNLSYTTPEILGRPLPHAGWRMVGPLMGSVDGLREPAIPPNDGRPLVYVALGTSFNNRPRLFQTALAALADEPVRVLVSTGRRVVAEQLGRAPANATVVPWVISRAVLREADVHVTQGGAGSVHESLLAGVPMLCVPQAADQSAWSGRVAELGAGAVATEETPECLRAGVVRLLGETAERERARQLQAGLRRYDGASIAIRAIDEALR